MGDDTPPSDEFHLEARDGATIVHFDDIQIAPDVKDALYALVQPDGRTRLVINLANVDYLSTHALGVLANLQKKVHEAHGRLTLCNLNPDVAKLFRMTKFDQIFEIHADPEDALRNLGQGLGSRP